MKLNDQRILKQIPHHVKSVFADKQVVPLPFHNLEHIRHSVKSAKKIARYYRLEKADRLILQAAVWFGEAGYLDDRNDPEAAGAGLARAFFAQNQADPELIEKVCTLILATKMPQYPSALLEEIICDCSSLYWGRKSFDKENKLRRQESELISTQRVTKTEWLTDTIKLMEAHQYFSEYGQSFLEPRKSVNLARLKQKLTWESEKDRPEKGIETMFRITSSNNQRLSDMADQKAHLLITVNSIILSAIISLVLRRLDSYDFLLYPTALLLSVCLAAMTLAILTTRPSITAGKFNIGDLHAKKINLLFFGNFYKMSLSEYTERMIKVMGDSELLYQTLISDVYGQGVVLSRKYGFLRTAYSIFMFGLILSVGAFITATIIHYEKFGI